MRLAGLLFAFLLAVATGGATAEEAASAGLQAVPALTRPVTDLTGTLGAADVERLEAKIRAFHAQHGAQFSVLVVQSTKPESEFAYAMRVVEQWQLGDAKRDNGLLLLVAMQDRRMQILVGYGLEGAIPDAAASRVVRNVLAPRFRDGDYAGGIDAALDALMALAAGDAGAAAEPAGDVPGGEGRMIAVLVAGIVLGGILSLVFGRMIGGLAGGASTLLIALLLGIGFGVAVFLSIMVLVFVFGRGAGGFGRGGFGGGLGGGFGGGGGWRGGGGGFGGGGASGGW